MQGVPAGPEAGGYGELLLTSVIVLVVVAALAALVVILARRGLGGLGRRGGRGEGLLEVVARVPLEPRRSLYVVEVAGKALLVGTSEMGLTVLTELDRAAVQAHTAARPVGFAELVRQAARRRLGSRPDAEVEVPAEGDAASAVAAAASAPVPMGGEGDRPARAAS
ncbi:MAG: flagellar biosynthetic protein FliO [Kofleriaceae bacterium]|jgi:flagellar biogenesis protein FliO|nr:flagellar biosynthetic protein FliO [Kofleriaceae bacterium]